MRSWSISQRLKIMQFKRAVKSVALENLQSSIMLTVAHQLTLKRKRDSEIALAVIIITPKRVKGL